MALARGFSLIALGAVCAAPTAGRADPACNTTCNVVGVDFNPATSDLQIVAWVEDSAGHYIDTIYVTHKIGLYGMGNRPGRFDFNSGPVVNDMWPYGRRITTFPVWAHRHGMTFPEVDFQDGDDDALSHPLNQSSSEVDPPYCQPLPDTDPRWDAGTCATRVNTDKGVFSATATSLYPPRADVTQQAGNDSASVAMFKALNPWDAISQATPPAGALATIDWPIPTTLAAGDYVMWVEVSRGFDFNASYNATVFPPPMVPFASYGEPYRGQPSVVYRVPFTFGTSETVSDALDYFGYSDPTGGDGAVRPPDATITTDTPGSGASRIAITADGTAMYRVRVDVKPEMDCTPPAQPASLVATTVAAESVTVQFTAPGDDGLVGMVSGYDIHVRANDPMTSDNFDDSMPIAATVAPGPSGSTQSVEIDGLLPETNYWVGVRAYDDCHNESELQIVELTTTALQPGQVDACFIATAAYGSPMANQVELLRHVRDSVLKSSVLGELAVETYYTFSPPVAGFIGQSDLLRATARAAISPVIRFVQGKVR